MTQLQSFNERFWGYKECTGMKLNMTYHMVDSLCTKVVENAYDFDAYCTCTSFGPIDGLVGKPDNALFPEWNPTKVVDILAPRV